MFRDKFFFRVFKRLYCTELKLSAVFILLLLVSSIVNIIRMRLAEKLRILKTLYLTFAKIGGVTFGGGLSMMAMFRTELIEKRNWITDEELLDYYAIGQSTPGIIAINVSTFIGYKQLGVLGGIVSTLGMITPSLVIRVILAKLIDSVDSFPLVKKALNGVNVAVAVLLTKISVDFGKKSITNVFSALVAVLSFGLVYFLKIKSFYIILFAVALGISLYFIKKLIRSKKEESDA